MKYVVLGDGWIGNYLKNKLYGVMDPRKITSQEDAHNIISAWPEADVIINCIGKTGRPNIDWCEDHKEETTYSNVIIPFYLAEECRRAGKYWIHIGSGCVYDGYQKEWTEEDPPNFYDSFYSTTKAISQDILLGYKEVCVLRIRMPISEDMTDERNYVAKLLKYIKEEKQLFNMRNSMTYLPDLVDVIKVLAADKATGTFNVVNPGPMIAREVLKLYDSKITFDLRSYIEVSHNLKAGRSNCVLSSEKLIDCGIVLPRLDSRLINLWKCGKENGS